MIEIKNRYDGSVIYTAKDAKDIRQAVEQAVREGAHLTRANLTGAHLTGANLTDANLARARLAGANLTDANLARARLAGANLTDANLTRAHLTDAHLTDAHLTGANLARAHLTDANLARAHLTDANLARAHLTDARLAGAHLTDANLARAHLTDAHLTGAHLTRANLTGAHLTGASGIHRDLTDDLRILLDQVGKIRAYKLVNAAGEGPQYGGIKYKIGETVKTPADTTDEHCAHGINLATLPWCLRNWRRGYRILVVEFTRNDIASIPAHTDGKFRVHKCKVIREHQFDPVEIGLTREAK